MGGRPRVGVEDGVLRFPLQQQLIAVNPHSILDTAIGVGIDVEARVLPADAQCTADVSAELLQTVHRRLLQCGLLLRRLIPRPPHGHLHCTPQRAQHTVEVVRVKHSNSLTMLAAVWAEGWHGLTIRGR